MNGASRYSGFFYFSLVLPRFIHCAALLLDLDTSTLTRFSKLNSVGMLNINTRIFEDLAKMDTNYLEAVEQAYNVFCYHARSKDVMSPMLMSACGPGQWSC